MREIFALDRDDSSRCGIGDEHIDIAGALPLRFLDPELADLAHVRANGQAPCREDSRDLANELARGFLVECIHARAKLARAGLVAARDDELHEVLCRSGNAPRREENRVTGPAYKRATEVREPTVESPRIDLGRLVRRIRLEERGPRLEEEVA